MDSTEKNSSTRSHGQVSLSDSRSYIRTRTDCSRVRRFHLGQMSRIGDRFEVIEEG